MDDDCDDDDAADDDDDDDDDTVIMMTMTTFMNLSVPPKQNIRYQTELVPTAKMVRPGTTASTRRYI